MTKLEHPSQRFLDPRVIGKIKSLQLRSKYLIDGLQAGLSRRPARGFSNEFSQHREFVAGDDHRHIDWKVFGRTDKYYLKQFEDESNLLSHLMLDVSLSMNYRGPDSALSKLEFGQCLAASLAWLTLNQHDAVDLTLFDNTTHQFHPPMNHPGAIPDLIAALDSSDAMKSKVARAESDGRKSDLGLMPAAQKLPKRGIAFVISDFFSTADNVINALRILRYQGNDVVAIQIVDRYEQQFPFRSTTLFRGMESPFSLVVNPRRIRKSYLKRFRAFCDRLQRDCAKFEIEFHQISTDTNIATAMEDVLSNRTETAMGH